MDSARLETAFAHASGMVSAVELRELRTFLAVAEERHFSRAATRLGVSPSRVSQTIRDLELKMGGRLFERTSRRVRLTPVGERFHAGIIEPYGAMERAFVDTRETITGIAGTLRIGLYLRITAGPHMTEIVHTFTARHPDCEVEFVPHRL